MLTWFLVAVSGVWWCLQGLGLRRAIRAVPTVDSLASNPRTSWPTVSLIIPARDEARHVGDALRARLDEGYPALEVVVVDDRSTDETGAVVEAIARRDARVRRVRITELAPGWLGKVHALQRGLEHAGGEWVLFSDADVHLAPGTLARVVAWAESEGLDHVAALPSIRAHGALLAPALASFFRMLGGLTRLWKVRDPNSNAAIGSGAFNLVRRSALERTEGLSWLRMEIGDDMALGVMLKRSGARQAALVGGEAISLEFYPDIRTMTRALEKNGAAAPMPLMIVGSALLVTLEAGFLVGLVAGGPAAACGVAIWGLASLVQDRAARWLCVPRWPAIVPFLGVFPVAGAIARSALLAFFRGGVRWRGTFYSTSTVRAGMRLGRGGA